VAFVGVESVYLKRTAVGLADCFHSKIARVRVLSWPLLVLTGLYFLRVTEVLSTSDRSVAQNSAVIGQLISQ